MFMKFICENCKQEYSRPAYTSVASKSVKQYWRDKEGSEFGLCAECYEAQKQADREAANAEAAEKAREMELPELTGTEKQVAWANTIRVKMIEEAQKLGEKCNAKPLYYRALDSMIQNPKASWYIDNRDKYIGDIISDIAKNIPAEEEKRIEQEVRAESAEYPENCQYNAPAEIIAKEDEVSVIFERNDTFRELVKGLGYAWIDGRWRRVINVKTGTATDRAAELGNKLLNAGFPISILDADTRRKAIEADYEPECDRWVFARTKGDYTGWLAIQWQGQDDRLYQAARKLPRSKWNSGSVVVKPEYFQEVEEFAQMFGFKFSDGAIRMISEAKSIKESAKVIVPAESKEVKNKDGLKEILDSGSDIIDDLKD
jgi:hypothetical protein